MFKLVFETNNEAFANSDYETRRILRWVTDQVERGFKGGKIYDDNGNRVGSWVWDTEDFAQSEAELDVKVD